MMMRDHRAKSGRAGESHRLIQDHVAGKACRTMRLRPAIHRQKPAIDAKSRHLLDLTVEGNRVARMKDRQAFYRQAIAEEAVAPCLIPLQGLMRCARRAN